MTMQDEFGAMARKERLKRGLIRESFPPGYNPGNRWMVDQHHSHKLSAPCLVENIFKLVICALPMVPVARNGMVGQRWKHR
jgi:hypothetical protein